MTKRTDRARVAAETVGVLQSGRYSSPAGVEVSILDSLQLAVHQTRLIAPGEARSLCERAGAMLGGLDFATVFEVRNETTFCAARRLVEQFGADSVAALNFASAKNPGGGFLNGSQAQEESLARASGLYPCLTGQMGYYDANRREKSFLYTDHLIVSPRVPVFRDDEDRLLDQPWETTIITSPAPNAGAMRAGDGDIAAVEDTFRRRIEHVLAAGVLYNQKALVLGAWGCGVFRNDPAMVARLFGEFLLNGGVFSRAFSHVAFAVLDGKGETIRAFAEMFGGMSG